MAHKKETTRVPVAIFIHPFAMVTVVVGSQSAPKLEAARQGFQRLVKTVEITGVAGQVGGVAWSRWKWWLLCFSWLKYLEIWVKDGNKLRDLSLDWTIFVYLTSTAMELNLLKLLGSHWSLGQSLQITSVWVEVFPSTRSEVFWLLLSAWFSRYFYS